MIPQKPRRLLLTLLLLISPVVSAGPATHGMVATAHPLATDAAVEILRNGGNAIDAAVTAGLTLGVVDSSNAGIGGGCFILIRLADGTFHAIDGRETAPAASRPDMYLIDGKADTSLSQTGALATGVPGALAAYAQAVEKFGRKPLADLLAPAIRFAAGGYMLQDAEAAKLAIVGEDFRKFEGSRAIYLGPDGKPWEKDHLFIQADLADTYRGIAANGTGHFYRGPVSQKIAAWMAGHGGILTEKDFADYTPKIREPLRTTYRGNQIIGFPPASSGGVHVAQILNILSSFDIAGMAEADRIHTIAEAMKLAFADRAYWLGDPDFTKVPKGLADPAYAKTLAARIDPQHAIKVERHSVPPGWEENVFGRHTTHFSAADAEGNWVAITATINTTYGSKVVVPGTGVVLNNEMDDFSIQPGVPNSFGLIGGEANKVEPGKRPLSAMSPTIVLDSAGKPILAVGAAGGPTIISQTVLAIVGMVDLKMSLQEALAQPRFHHQWVPETLRVENRMPAPLLRQLEAKGHIINNLGRTMGVSQAVGWDGTAFTGASDPRILGKAAGW